MDPVGGTTRRCRRRNNRYIRESKSVSYARNSAVKQQEESDEYNEVGKAFTTETKIRKYEFREQLTSWTDTVSFTAFPDSSDYHNKSGGSLMVMWIEMQLLNLKVNKMQMFDLYSALTSMHLALA